jgi:hypothetical protein
MIEEMFNTERKKLIAAVEEAQKEMTDLEGSKSALSETLDVAKKTLEAKTQVKMAAMFASEAAKTATKTAETASAKAIEAQTKADADHANLEKEKAAIEVAYQEHFKAPMDANECPQHTFLKPFVDTLGLEESLISALPSSCMKPKDQRGGFDELVLVELGKAFVAKIAAIGQSIVEAAASITARKADVASAEAVLETKKAEEKTCADAFDAAVTEQSEAEAKVTKASEEWSAFEPKVQEATDKHNLHDTKRIDFEEGAFKDFATLRDKEAPASVEEEAAVAGA